MDPASKLFSTITTKAKSKGKGRGGPLLPLTLATVIFTITGAAFLRIRSENDTWHTEDDYQASEDAHLFPGISASLAEEDPSDASDPGQGLVEVSVSRSPQGQAASREGGTQGKEGATLGASAMKKWEAAYGSTPGLWHPYQDTEVNSLDGLDAPKHPLPQLPVPANRSKAFLEGVLLVVAFRSTREAARLVPLLHRTYSRAFWKLLFVAPQAANVSGIRVLRYGRPPQTDPNDTEAPAIQSGMRFDYFFLHTVYVRFRRDPNLQGVLWADGGAVLNYWTLLAGDKRRLWAPPVGKRDTSGQSLWGAVDIMDSSDDDAEEDPAEHGPIGAAPAEDNKTESPADWASTAVWKIAINSALNQFSEMHTDQLKTSMAELKSMLGLEQGSQSAPKGPSSVFYIPAWALPEVATLVRRLFRWRVPAEVAVPTIFMAMVSPSNIDTVLNTFLFIAPSDTLGVEQRAKGAYTPYVAGVYPWPHAVGCMESHLRHVMVQGDDSLGTS